MKKPKSKYYVVWEGRQPGIYDSWDKCRKQVEGMAGAKYKGFLTAEEAAQAFKSNAWNYIGRNAKPEPDQEMLKKCGMPLRDAICVDAACSGNPGVLEYRGVHLPSGKEIFHRGPFPEGTTNIGEFLAIVTGLVWLKQNNSPLPLYSDSRNAILWTKQKRVNTKLEPSHKNQELFALIDRAVSWLHANRFDTRILKWETKAWGEIPADFGRK
jgi:ribonuclease HI